MKFTSASPRGSSRPLMPWPTGGGASWAWDRQVVTLRRGPNRIDPRPGAVAVRGAGAAGAVDGGRDIGGAPYLNLEYAGRLPPPAPRLRPAPRHRRLVACLEHPSGNSMPITPTCLISPARGPSTGSTTPARGRASKLPAKGIPER